jgi:hypothetical protein
MNDTPLARLLAATPEAPARDAQCVCGHLRHLHHSSDFDSCDGNNGECPCERFDSARLCGGAWTAAQEQQAYLRALHGKA